MIRNWQTLLVLLASIKGAHLQCFPGYDKAQVANTTNNINTFGITDFGLKLFKELTPSNVTENFFFSPYLIWSGLTLAYFGAEGDAEQELMTNLNLTDKSSAVQLWKSLEELYKQRQKNNTLYTLNLANRVYFDNSVKVEKCLNDTLQENFRVFDVKDVTKAAKDVNTFVSQTTKGRIPQIVQSQDLQGVLMVLVNAAFFKGTWKYQFKPSSTQEREFYLNSRETIQLPMMLQKGNFRYGVSRELGARILELPYAGQEMSMFVLLPFAVKGPPAFRFTKMMKNLNSTALQRALNPVNMSYNNVEVLLPKFKFTHKVGFELERALERMNISDVFNGNLTAFDPAQSLSLNKIIHQAFVEVNEEGTEAAAITISIALSLESEPVEDRVVMFHCTEPFVFLIHDNVTKNILFVGAVRNPRG